MTSDRAARLEALIGEWTIHPDFPSLPPVEGHGTVTFAWMPGETFLVERWEVPVPEAPDGLAVIGFDEGGGPISSTTSIHAASPGCTR